MGVDDNNLFCVFEAKFWIPSGSGSNEWDIDSKLWRCGGVPDQGLEEHTGRRRNKERHTHTLKKPTPLPFEKVDGNKAEKPKKKKIVPYLTFQEVPCMGSVIALP